MWDGQLCSRQFRVYIPGLAETKYGTEPAHSTTYALDLGPPIAPQIGN